MGVTTPVRPGPEQDLLLRAATEEIQDRGFITSTVDSLVGWARSGSLWPGVLMHWLAVLAWKLWLGGPTAVFG